MAWHPVINETQAVDHSDLHGAEVVDQVLLIPTHLIERGERLRNIDPVWAAALGQLMLRDGQQTPVEVCRLPGRTTYTLVAGGHRHAGAEHVGIQYLRAIQVSAGRDDRRMREVNENLWRKDLDPVDRAAFIAEAVAIQKRRAGIAADASRVAKVNGNKAITAEATDMLETISSTYGWSEEIGAQLGFTGRTIRNDLFLYRRLAPSLVARLREARHPAAVNATQLRALAKLDEAQQGRAVDMLLDGRARGAADAVKALSGKRAPDPADKRFSTIIGTLARMGHAERAGLLQSPDFHALLPAEARVLLAPMLRSAEA